MNHQLSNLSVHSDVIKDRSAQTDRTTLNHSATRGQTVMEGWGVTLGQEGWGWGTPI